MVLETKINAKIVAWVDKQSFNKAEQTARDTGKVIDQNLKKKLEIDVANTQIKLKNLRKQLRDTTLPLDKRRQLLIETNRTQRSLTEAKRKLNNLINTWDAWTSRLQAKFNGIWKSIVSSLINPITIAITAIYSLGRAIVNATKTARSFETAFVWVQKTFDDTAEWYDILEKRLRKLARQLPVTFEELAWIAEVSWQLWVKWRDNLIEFTRVAAWLGIATNLSAEEAATSLKRFADVLWVPITEIENLWSALVWLGNNFAANEQEILGFATQAQTAWLLSNLTATEILWLSTALVASWINAEAWGTAIVKVFWQINDAAAKWWSELQKFATVAWLTSEEFKALVEDNTGEAFVKVLEWINSAWTDAGRVLDELWINNLRLRKTILAGSWNFETLKEAIKSASEEYKNNNALQDEVQKRLASTDWRLQIAKNKWRDVSASIWDWFNKVRVPVFEWITKLLENFVLNTKVSFQFIRNIFYNIDTAAQNLAAWIVNWFQKARNWITDFVNWIIKTYNKLASKLWLKELSIIDTKELNLVEKRWFKSLTEWIQEITDEYDYNKKQQLKLAEDSIKKEIELQTWLLDEISNLDDKSTSNKKENLKEYEDAVKDMTDTAWKAYDDLTKKIEWSVKAQQKLKDEIAWIDEDIAKRIVEIDEALAWDDLEASERQALQQERWLAFKGLSDEEVQALKDRVTEISEFEKLTEIEKLQAQKELKQQALDEEIAQEKTFKDQLKELEDNFMDYLVVQKDKELAMAEQLRQKWLAVAAARASAGGWGGSIPWRAVWWPVSAWSPYIVGERWPELFMPESSGKIVPNNELTNNININANVSNDIELDRLANELARKIQLSRKGIF